MPVPDAPEPHAQGTALRTPAHITLSQNEAEEAVALDGTAPSACWTYFAHKDPTIDASFTPNIFRNVHCRGTTVLTYA